MKTNIFLILCSIGFFFTSCSTQQRKKPDNDKIVLCINNYVNEMSSIEEYQKVRDEFFCFYEKANKSSRSNYDSPVEQIELDSLMIFNLKRDSVLLFYYHDGSKVNNGKLHYIVYKFAYKDNNNKWIFYDTSCLNSIYSISKYSKTDVIKDTYLHLAKNEEWLIDEITCKFDTNFTKTACNNFCGPCRLERELKINPDAIKFYIPIPDSLFGCK